MKGYDLGLIVGAALSLPQSEPRNRSEVIGEELVAHATQLIAAIDGLLPSMRQEEAIGELNGGGGGLAENPESVS